MNKKTVMFVPRGQDPDQEALSKEGAVAVRVFTSGTGGLSRLVKEYGLSFPA
ncbi:MAG: hypothetical protein KJ804_10100 [Proteobacteria bacterium]|nr:hypothetical protein [Pseudomonadota bacterium]MBU1058654.1 hypothetical protein [Pseudomonadota bacterium]